MAAKYNRAETGKRFLTCAAAFLIVLFALMLPAMAERTHAAAPGETTNFKVEDPSLADVWAPQVKISWEGAGSSGWIIGCEESGFAATSYMNSVYDTDTIFEDGKQYNYKIYYQSDSSKSSSFLYAPDMTKFTPSAISGSAKASGNAIELTWPKLNDLKVNIYQGGTKLATVSSSDESYIISGLSYSTAYTYKIAYVNQHKEGPQQTLTAATEAKPSDESGSGSGDSGSGSSDSGSSGSGGSGGSGSGDSTVPDGSGNEDAYDPNTPNLGWTSLWATKITKKKVILRWTKNYSADGFYIYKNKKKVKTVKASVTKVTIKGSGAAKAKYTVIPYANYKGNTYKGLCNPVKPKANTRTTSNTFNYKAYDYGKGQVVMKQIKAAGKKYTVTCFAINNRMFKLIKYKKISIKIYADGKCVAKKTIKNKKVNMKKYKSKKLVFKMKGKEADIANGSVTWDIKYKPYWEHGYKGF